MTPEADAALEARLAHRERELSLVLEIDRIRDENARDPRKMLSAIVETIFEALHADAGLLALIDEPSGIVWEAKVDPDAILPTLSENALYQVAQAAGWVREPGGTAPTGRQNHAYAPFCRLREVVIPGRT